MHELGASVRDGSYGMGCPQGPVCYETRGVALVSWDRRPKRAHGQAAKGPAARVGGPGERSLYLSLVDLLAHGAIDRHGSPGDPDLTPSGVSRLRYGVRAPFGVPCAESQEHSFYNIFPMRHALLVQSTEHLVHYWLVKARGRSWRGVA